MSDYVLYMLDQFNTQDACDDLTNFDGSSWQGVFADTTGITCDFFDDLVNPEFLQT